MNGLGRIKLAKIIPVVRNDDKIALMRNVPVFPAGLSDMSHVMRFMACLNSDGNQVQT
jgi:hypothetical protein